MTVEVRIKVPGGETGHAVVVSVGESVAVLVDIVGVADFGRARVDVGVDVVAVGRIGDIAAGRIALFDGVFGVAVSIAVGIPVVRARKAGARLVDNPITVIVAIVADLVAIRTHVDIAVITVVGVVDKSARREAAGHDVVGIAVPVAIGVCVERAGVEGMVLVGLAIAVVVDPVAVLVGKRMHIGIVVVAVGFGDPLVSVSVDHQIGLLGLAAGHRAERQHQTHQCGRATAQHPTIPASGMEIAACSRCLHEALEYPTPTRVESMFDPGLIGSGQTPDAGPVRGLRRVTISA